MPLYELTLRTRMNEQECINRFTYQGSGIPASVSMSFALTKAMGWIPAAGVYPIGSIADWLISHLANNITFDETQSRNLYSTTDFYTTPFLAGTTGNATTEALPPFAAYGFRTNRVRLDIRRGTRRFPGVTEGVVGDGGFLTVSGLSLVQDLADRMSETLTYDDEGNTLTFVPVVLGKQAYAPSPGRVAYRYYPTEAEQLNHVASGLIWEPYNSVRSQTSRQYGRGS